MKTETELADEQRMRDAGLEPGKPLPAHLARQQPAPVEAVIQPCAGDVIERTHGVLTLLADLAAGSSKIGQNDGREIMDFAKWLDDQINTFVAGLIAKKRRDLAALEKTLGNPPATIDHQEERRK